MQIQDLASVIAVAIPYIGIGLSSVALTQIVKDFGLSGEWNKLACVVIAVGLGVIQNYEPAVWSTLVLPLIGATGTGGVSLLQELSTSKVQP